MEITSLFCFTPKSENDMLLKDFFYLQKNDRQAIVIILTVLIICTTLVFVLGKEDEEVPSSPVDSTAIANASREHPLYYKVDEKPHELFPFDPNTADSTTLLRLGLEAWQVRSIYHYRAKGGVYRRSEDFARLYGLTKRQYEVLRPFIRISDDYRPAADFYGNERRMYSYATRQEGTATEKEEKGERIYSYPQKLNAGEHIAVNSADTAELKKIPGVGSVYARAIIRYRNRLGGFVKAEQLLEITGIPESALSYISIDKGNISKMNVNRLSLNKLCQHPYINFYQAKEICDYRRTNGPLESMQDLKLLKDFPQAEIERLEPYVEF